MKNFYDQNEQIHKISRILLASFAMFGSLTFSYQIHATTVLKTNFNTMIDQAELIIDGEVIDIYSEWSDNRTTIHTYVTLGSLQVIHGDVAGATVTLQFMGGQVGDDIIAIPGSPTFDVGDREVLFVRNNGAALSPIVGFYQGRFQVIDDVMHDHADNPIMDVQDNTLVKLDMSTAQSQELGVESKPTGISAGTPSDGVFRYQESNGESALRTGADIDDSPSRPSEADIIVSAPGDGLAAAAPKATARRSDDVSRVNRGEPSEIMMSVDDDTGERVTVAEFISMITNRVNP